VKNKKRPFDKYYYYFNSVQSPNEEARNARQFYREIRKKTPTVFCEDFCGTFAISCEWVKLNPKNKAYAVDIDPEPLAYDSAHYFSRLNINQKKRLRIFLGSVTSKKAPHSDIIAALNFSTFFFKKRSEMLSYFKGVRKRLKPGGIFIMDCMGGPNCHEPHMDRHKFPGFT
jgi:SAM-dependent methyltransferase